MPLSIYQRIVSDAFDSEKWKYTSKNVSEKKIVFMIDFTFNNSGTTHCEISIFDSGICDIEVYFPISCPKEKHMELCYYLAQYNCLRRYATLRLDINKENIINRYGFVFNQATTPKDFLKTFVGAKDVDDAVLKDVIAICNENTPSEQKDASAASQSINTGKNSKHKLTL